MKKRFSVGIFKAEDCQTVTIDIINKSPHLACNLKFMASCGYHHVRLKNSPAQTAYLSLCANLFPLLRSFV